MPAPDARAEDAAVLVERDGHPPWFRFPYLDALEIAFCGFSTRRGGVSPAPYDSLNLGSTTRDDPANVAENRLRQALAFGYPLQEHIRLEHGCRVHLVEKCGDRSLDSEMSDLSPHSGLPVADAVITRERGVPITIYYADCVPVVVMDPVRRAVGVAHAGWRGTVVEVARATVEAMGEQFGSRPSDLHAGIGSSIGPCCMEVGPEVVEAVGARFPQWQESVIRGTNRGTSTLDLWELNGLQLMGAGVPRNHIASSRLCTACRTDLFFSYRRDRRDTGRLAMLVCLP